MSQLLSLSSSSASLMVALIFAALGIGAALFVAWPAWRTATGGRLARALLGGAIACFVIGIGGGGYLLLGHPELAARSFAAPGGDDVPALVAALAARMRNRPGDLPGWTLLGRGYLTLGDPGQAAIAFRHASEIAPPARKPGLLSAYGEALTLGAGNVTPEAESAFEAALAGNPGDQAARFYLGQAYADRREPAKALAMWQGLLADAPANAPWRTALVNRMALLQSQTGSAPDVSAMVAGLALRLKTNPDDPDGWGRLVRAYAVLNKKDEARAALASAQVAMKGNSKALAALKAEAVSLGLEK